MATIDMRRSHALSDEQARGKAEELARSMQAKLGIQWRWVGSQIKFDAPSGVAKGATGTVSILEREVRVEIDLPLMLRPMKGMVEGKVRDKLDALLASPLAVTAIKVCGVTNVDDALACVDLGVDAVGLNFVPASPRRVDLTVARAITDAIGTRALVVAVVADLDRPAIEAILSGSGAKCVQLHGDEPPALVEALLPHAYKAVRIRDAADVARAAAYPGEFLLVDAKVEGALGGTGATFDWALAAELARTRKLTVAGGLSADNVGRAIEALHPFCVDVASGVERAHDPRRKDRARLEAFVAAVRR